jgi:hypothetical protein
MSLPDKSEAAGTFGAPFADAHQVEDPTTDQSAAQYNQMCADVAMGTHTAIRATMLFTGATYTAGTMHIVPDDHEAVWGSGTGVRPDATQAVSGTYVIVWATTYDDELGDSHTTNIRFPDCVAYGVSTLVAKVQSWTANTITIATTSAGAANALNGTKIKVWFI